jgi:uncharacterized membrane protein
MAPEPQPSSHPDEPPPPPLPVRRRSAEVLEFRKGPPVAAEIVEGPLPSAGELARYKEVYPGAPRIILDEFRLESLHRRQLEAELLRDESGRATRGQIFALVTLLVGLLLGAWLVDRGHDTAGALIAGGNLLGMAAMFVRGAREARDEQRAVAAAGS